LQVDARGRFNWAWTLGLAVVGLGLFLVLAPQAAAQGCAMCYQSAAASGEQGRQALRSGILILLFPTLSLFLGIFGLVYSRRNVSRLTIGSAHFLPRASSAPASIEAADGREKSGRG